MPLDKCNPKLGLILFYAWNVFTVLLCKLIVFKFCVLDE